MSAISTPGASRVLPPVGDLMTVQIHDADGTWANIFHGTRGGIHNVATTIATRRDTRQVRYLRTIGAADSPMTGEDPATVAQYLTIHSATDGPFKRGSLDRSGPEHFFSAGDHSLSVLLHGAKTIVFTAATQDGEQWVHEHRSLDQRKSSFLARLGSTHPQMASEAAALFDEVAQQARHRGFAEGMDSAGGS